MKMLVAAPRPLYPAKTGLEIRVYYLLKPLCSKHDISLVCFSPSVDSYAIDPELKKHFTKIELVKPDTQGRKRSGLAGRVFEWFAPSEVPLGDIGASLNMRDKIRTLVDSGGYDLALIASPFMVNYFLGIDSLPIVFDAIDDTTLLFWRDIGLAKNILAKGRAFKDWLIIRQVEKKFYSRFKEIVISSPIDAEAMSKFCPRSTISVVPHGVDSAYFESHYPESEEPTLIFSGVMNYGPNVLAALYFCDSIFPLIIKEFPRVKLLIVGRNPTAELKALEKNHPGIEVTGEVDDIRPYLGRANVYVCPLVSGAGLKFKVLEAWASNRAVVATSLSCDGIEVAPNEDILVADEPGQFAEAVIRFLRNPDLRRAMAAKGRAKVVRLYDWASKADQLEKVLLRAADTKKG